MKLNQLEWFLEAHVILKIQLWHHSIKSFQIENSYIVVIFHNITVLMYFDQINAAWVSIRNFFQNH